MELPSAFEIKIDHLQEFAFNVTFTGTDLPEMVVDEPVPLGRGIGPNASRLLGVAVGNCLAASLLFCLRKARLEPAGIHTTVTGTLTRNERKRLRIRGMNVEIDLIGLPVTSNRIKRCLEIFEDFCVVTASVRQGMTVAVTVCLEGQVVHSSV